MAVISNKTTQHSVGYNHTILLTASVQKTYINTQFVLKKKKEAHSASSVGLMPTHFRSTSL